MYQLHRKTLTNMRNVGPILVANERPLGKGQTGDRRAEPFAEISDTERIIAIVGFFWFGQCCLIPAFASREDAGCLLFLHLSVRTIKTANRDLCGGELLSLFYTAVCTKIFKGNYKYYRDTKNHHDRTAAKDHTNQPVTGALWHPFFYCSNEHFILTSEGIFEHD